MSIQKLPVEYTISSYPAEQKKFNVVQFYGLTNDSWLNELNTNGDEGGHSF